MSDRSRLRLAILRVLVLSLIGTLFGRLWYLQVMAGAEYRQVAASNRLREVVTPAIRGRIIDEQGMPLVRNRTAMVVTVNRNEITRTPDKGTSVLNRLGKLLGVPAGDLAKQIRPCGPQVSAPCWNGSPLQPVPVAEDVSPSVAFAIQERREDYPGVEASLQAVREYPGHTIAAHALGYIGPIREDEYKAHKDEGYYRNDLIGRSGLEQIYDAELRGRSGVKLIAVRRGERVTGVVGTRAPEPGNDLVLSLDQAVQSVADKSLAEHILQRRKEHNEIGFYPAVSGAVVVLEAKTGRVIALSSYPTYDPTRFIGGISTKEYEALTAVGSGTPLTSRATQGQFAPASTFKLVSSATAIVEGRADFSGKYDCSATYQLGDERGRVFRQVDKSDQGPMTLHTAIVKSCDTIYYRWAAEDFFADRNLESAGQQPKEAMQRMARAFGLGRETGIDLPSEVAGRVPDRKFKKDRWERLKATYCRRAQTGYPDEPNPDRRTFLHLLAKENCSDGFRYTGGDYVNLSIGQGEALVTPLQLAVAYAALANGGTLFSPRLAKAVVSPEGQVLRTITPPVSGRLPLAPEILAGLRAAMADVTVSGTAAGAFAGFPLGQVHVAGKTGTGQVQGKQDTSWFASFAPANDPEFVVVAMVEQAGFGAEVAAPIVRDVYEGIYGLAGKKAALPGGHTPRELPTLLPDGAVLRPGATASPSPGATATPSAAATPMSLAPVEPARPGYSWRRYS